MNTGRKLKLLLIRVVAYNLAFAAYLLWPGLVGLGVAGTIVLVTRLAGGKILIDPNLKLEAREKNIYFFSICLCGGVWLVLLLAILIRHSTPRAWAIGTVPIMILIVILLYSYAQIYGPHAKV